MKQQRTKPQFPIGLVLYAFILAIYKAAILTHSIGADWLVLATLAGLDLFFISMLLLLAILLGYMKSAILRFVPWALLVLMTATYLVDSFVLLALDDHAVLFDIGRYSLEPGMVLSFFDTAAYVAIALLLLSLFLKCEFTLAIKKLSFAALVISLLLGGAATAFTPAPLARYTMFNPASFIASFGPQSIVFVYTGEQIEFYAGLKQERAEIPVSKPNIILVVMESLSSINSNKTSSVGNLLAGFDELAQEGLLFKNFFANHQASEGGLIALLGGYPPIHFPTATPYMFDEFASQSSVISEYREKGYFTEFLTNSDLTFIGMDHFLQGLNLDRSRGRDEVVAMRAAPRVVQDAPADDLLYAEALASSQALAAGDQPYLMVLVTASTHLPYTHPKGGPATPKAVWDWSLQRLIEFQRQLSENEFFKHGILLITGDHRQMRPITQAETRRYGDSARARVPLLVIGKDYPRGAVDERFFQQSDLFRMLDRLLQTGAQLSPQPIWVERYNRKYGRIEMIDKLGVFDQADAGRHEYHLKVSGNHIEWLGDKPSFAREVETRIHRQRSEHQANR